MSNKPNRTTFRERMDTMVAGLRDEIVGGILSVGSFLPSEVELGKRYQLSKNSVRKGLDMLVAEKLIEKVPCVGTRVCAPAVQGGVTIRLGCYSGVMEQTGLNRILSEFHVAFPHIRVQTVALPFVNYHESIMDCLHNGMLDAFTVNQNDFCHFAENDNLDWLEPIDPPSGLYPFLHRAFVSEKRQYAVPFVFSPVVLCYNRDHFAAKNMREPDSSWTWSDFLTAAAQLSEGSGRFGFYFYLLSLNRWPVFLLQSGAKFRAERDGAVRIAGTKLQEALALCRELIDSGSFLSLFAEGTNDAEFLFSQEKVSMIMTTYFSLNYIQNKGFAFDISPLPYFEQPASLLSAIGLGINRKSEHKEAVRTLIDYLLDYPAQLSVRQNSHSIPSLIQAAEWSGQGSVKHPSRYHMYREIIPTFKYVTDLHITPAELDMMNSELKMYWSKLEREDDVCRRLETLMSPVTQ